MWLEKYFFHFYSFELIEINKKCQDQIKIIKNTDQTDQINNYMEWLTFKRCTISPMFKQYKFWNGYNIVLTQQFVQEIKPQYWQGFIIALTPLNTDRNWWYIYGKQFEIYKRY